jgi:hypothetical protein
LFTDPVEPATSTPTETATGGGTPLELLTIHADAAGDERRALRRFIDENERIVREQLQDAPNRFSHDWDEWLYGLLEEEYRFWIYE